MAEKYDDSPRVKYIHGIGVNTDRLQNQDMQSDIRKELSLSTNDFLVLSVGELDENKNQQVVIRAIAQLGDPDVHYLLCGKGDQREHLEQLAKELHVKNNVHFLGYRMDIPEIMKAADIYAHPSKREGLGLASLEVMACGLPLVTSNIQGIPDYVENGVTGFTCDPEDVDSFVEHLRQLINNPALREKIAETNLRKSDKYSIANLRPVIAGMIDCDP